MAKPYYKTAIGPKSYLDDRNDLGYGRLKPKFHQTRTHGDPTFPYIESDEDVEDVDINDETMDAVMWNTIAPQNFDPGAKKGTTPYSFVDGATRLGERATSGISPFPTMYKYKHDTVSGGRLQGRTARADASTMAPTIDPGDRWGWSSTPDQFEDDEDEPAYSLEDIGKKNLRECVRHYILQYWRIDV